MTIKNSTVLSKEAVKGAMRASNFDNNRYKAFKIIYNSFGLVSGMMAIRYLIMEMIGSQDENKWMLVIFVIVAAVFLYLGMYGMDRSNMRRFNLLYKNKIGKEFQYEIDSDEIHITEAGKDPEVFSWNQVEQWNQDTDRIYLYIKGRECAIIDNKGFSQCDEKDLRDLAKAVFALRKDENETASEDKEQ
jgi:hypothetical protein